jgi:hypothetical protein
VHEVCDVPDPIVLTRSADIERLIVNAVSRCLKEYQKCSTEVLHMDERAPGSAVALDENLADRGRVAYQIVHHEIHT